MCSVSTTRSACSFLADKLRTKFYFCGAVQNTIPKSADKFVSKDMSINADREIDRHVGRVTNFVGLVTPASVLLAFYSALRCLS